MKRQCSTFKLRIKHYSLTLHKHYRIPIGFLFIDLSDSTTKKIPSVLHSEATTTEMLEKC